jgi:hypothetical protein
MKVHRYFVYLIAVFLLGVTFVGCRPKIDTMAKAEKIFIKMVDKTAAKLDLTEDQKIQLERLKIDIRKNFQDGGIERRKALVMIKEEGMKEKPEINKMTGYLQGALREETQRINQAFDLMLDFQKNLNDDQKKKLTQMISDWVAKWD